MTRQILALILKELDLWSKEDARERIIQLRLRFILMIYYPKKHYFPAISQKGAMR